MKKVHGELFLLGLWLGATVFGGAAQAYGVIRKAVTDRGWLTAEEVDGIYPLATFLPGPSFMNLWGAVAVRIGGLRGAVLGQIGLMLPSFLLVCCLPLLAHVAYIGDRTGGAMVGATWATAGLLLAAAVDGLRTRPTAGEWAKVTLLFALLWLGVHPLVLTATVVAWGAGRYAGPAAHREA